MSSSDKSVIDYATYMADPLIRDTPHQEGVLRVNRKLASCAAFHPANEQGYRLAQQEFSAEAARVVDFLQRTMPQGLTDAIFAELARRKASIFHVAEKNRDSEAFIEWASGKQGPRGWQIRRIQDVTNESVMLEDGVSFSSAIFPGAEEGDLWAVEYEPGHGCFDAIRQAALLERKNG